MPDPKKIRLFLCGDVMLGRGIDQVLPFPSPPAIHESYLHSAQDYVTLAERRNGPIPKPVDFEYIWGEALKELQEFNPDVRIVNLETAVTRNPRWMAKGINYRMNPFNIPCLTTAQIDVAILANNHVLDWKEKGLLETLETIKKAQVQTAGAGTNLKEASAPAEIRLPQKGSVQIFAFALPTSGVPEPWAATDQKPGVSFLEDLSDESFKHVQEVITKQRQPDSAVILSLHWGDNWGFEITEEQRNFAERLIDEGLVDVVYGHSSHHPKAVEVYKGKLVLYGCGDFINDYEGIRGYEQYRSDLVLMYFVELDALSKNLTSLRMVPLKLKNFHLSRPEPEEISWLHHILNREEMKFNNRVQVEPDERAFKLQWTSGSD